jgi:septum formation protein
MLKTQSKPLILASASPRRKDLLQQIGCKFIIDPAKDFNEQSDEPSAHELVQQNAHGKALEIAKKHPDSIILGVDTVGSLEDHILEKPKDLKDAHRMLSLMQGRGHQVLSGICLIETGPAISGAPQIIKSYEGIEETTINFSKLNEEEISSYLASEDVMDKAAAYAIQGKAATFIEGIVGDYFNVVGLPIHHLATALKKHFDFDLLTG